MKKESPGKSRGIFLFGYGRAITKSVAHRNPLKNSDKAFSDAIAIFRLRPR